MARLHSGIVGAWAAWQCLTQDRVEFIFPGADEVPARNGGLGTAPLFTSRVADCDGLLAPQMCPKLVTASE